MSISSQVGKYTGKPIKLYRFLSKNKVLFALTIGPALLLFAFINIVPIFWTFAASFHEIGIYSPEWTWIGLEGYRQVLADPDFWSSLSKATIFAVSSTIFQLIVGVGLALLVNKSFKFANVTRSIIMIPYLIPAAVLGFLGLWMGNSSWGVINSILFQVGLIENYIPWFGSPDWAMPAVVLTSSWRVSIFVTIMVLARLQSIPDGLYEAAEVAGASSWRKFRDITLPNLKGVIFIVVLLRGVWMFNKFDIIFVLTRGGPGGATTTTPIHAYNTMFGTGNIGETAVISVILFGMIATAAILYFWILEPSEEVRVE